MHAAQFLLTIQVYPVLMPSVAQTRGTFDRNSTLFTMVAKFYLRGVVLMFWHDIVYIELLYCVTNSELVQT